MEIFGYTFKNDDLLSVALTTPSFRMDSPGAADNQRLEFLGDAVLSLMSAEHLYARCPEEREGVLTVKRARMVSTPALRDAALRLGLPERLRRSAHAEPLTGKSKCLADAIEAILGAVYLDGGLDAARAVFKTLELPSHSESGAWSANPKGDLQVRAQALKPPRQPVYRLLSTKGKAHAPIFTVKATVEGVGEATATASSRQAAESLAAADLLSRFPAG